MIVLVHGLAVGRRYFDRLARELDEQLDDDVRQPEVREPLPVPELAERFAAAFEGPSLVVANSMGCQVAAELAVRRPELVEALVLVGPTVDPSAGGWVGHAGRLVLDAWYEPPGLTAIVARDYLSMGPVDVLRQARHALAHRIEAVLPRVEQPAVVVRGAHDPICSAGWAREVAGRLPHGRFVTVAGAGHAVHYSHPREVARLVTELRESPVAAG